jgi:hypothetical protein
MLYLLLLLLCVVPCFAGAPVIEWQRQFPDTTNTTVEDVISSGDGGAVIALLEWRGSRANKCSLLQIDGRGIEQWRIDLPDTANCRRAKLARTHVGGYVMATELGPHSGYPSTTWISFTQLNRAGEIVSSFAVSDTIRLQLELVREDREFKIEALVSSADGSLRRVSERASQRLWGVRIFSDLAWCSGPADCYVGVGSESVVEDWGRFAESPPPAVYSLVNFRRVAWSGPLVDAAAFRADDPSWLQVVYPYPSGGYFAAGSSDPKGDGFGTAALYFVRYSPHGDTIWTRRTPENYGRLWGAIDAVSLPSGDLVGISSPPIAAPRDLDFYLAGLDSTGHVSWEQYYGSGLFHVAKMCVATDGGLLLVGKAASDPDKMAKHLAITKLKFR